jgi:hypothetical protein
MSGTDCIAPKEITKLFFLALPGGIFTSKRTFSRTAARTDGHVGFQVHPHRPSCHIPSISAIVIPDGPRSYATVDHGDVQFESGVLARVYPEFLHSRK